MEHKIANYMTRDKMYNNKISTLRLSQGKTISGDLTSLLPCLTSCAGGRHNMPRPLQVDLLTLKVMSESRVTCATSVPILVFLGLSVLDLVPMYATDV